MTLSCIVEVNACERDAVQANGVMEQCGPWGLASKACALFLSRDCACVGILTWVVDTLVVDTFGYQI